MLFNTLGGVAALAGLSNAFLIPPTIEAVDSNIANTISFEAHAAATSDQLLVNCYGCPVVFDKEGAVSHAHTKLRFNMTIAEDNGADALLLNGIKIFPVDVASASNLKGLHADQVIRGPNAQWLYAAFPQLGYSMNTRQHQDRNHPGLTAYNIHLRVTEVGKEVVHRVPAIDIKLIKTASGKLMLANSHVSHGPSHDIVAVVSNPQCSSTLCRWRITFMQRISSLRKGCGGKSNDNRLPRPHGIFKAGPAGRPRPAGFEHRRPYTHRQRRHGGIARIIRSIVFHILVPMAIGLAVGITASIVGAIVGHLIVFIWRVLFRRGERGQCNSERIKESDFEDEKTAFLEAQEGPPLYEDAVEDEKTEQK